MEFFLVTSRPKESTVKILLENYSGFSLFLVQNCSFWSLGEKWKNFKMFRLKETLPSLCLPFASSPSPFFTFLPLFVSFFLLSIYQASFQRENFPWRSWNITFKEVSYGWVVEQNIHYKNNIFLSYSPVLYFWIIWMHVWFKRSLCLAQVRKYFDTCGTNQNFASCPHLP